MSESVRIYINGKPIDVGASATALEAVAIWDESEAAAIRVGERTITDSRGITIGTDQPVHNGAIFRIVRARQSVADDSDFDSL